MATGDTKTSFGQSRTAIPADGSWFAVTGQNNELMLDRMYTIWVDVEVQPLYGRSTVEAGLAWQGGPPIASRSHYCSAGRQSYTFGFHERVYVEAPGLLRVVLALRSADAGGGSARVMMTFTELPDAPPAG